MRNIFFSLLILNFAYLAYVVYSPVTPASVAAIPAVQPMPSGVGTLVLTTEIANGLERARQLNQVVNNPIYGEASDNVQCPALGPLTDLFAVRIWLKHLRHRRLTWSCGLSIGPLARMTTGF